MNDSLSLLGRWQMVRAVMSGEAAPELVVRHTTLQFTAGTYSIAFQGETKDAGEYAASTDCQPAQLVLRARTGANAGRTLPCIFQHVGNRLRICVGLDATCPTDFTTQSGDARYVATYRRIG